MRSKKKRGRFGTLVFFIPIVLVVAVVGYAIISGTGSREGTLVVTARSSGRYYASVGLNASFAIGTRVGVTPQTFTLTEGTYTVTFSSLPWFSTPQPRTLNVLAGKTSSAVGEYDPFVKVVLIVQNGFNGTSITAGHGVTPVVFINGMSGPVILQNDIIGTVSLRPSENFTHVFERAGTFPFTLAGNSTQILTVVVR